MDRRTRLVAWHLSSSDRVIYTPNATASTDLHRKVLCLTVGLPYRGICCIPLMDIHHPWIRPFYPWMEESTNGMQHICIRYPTSKNPTILLHHLIILPRSCYLSRRSWSQAPGLFSKTADIPLPAQKVLESAQGVRCRSKSLHLQRYGT